MNKEIKAKWIEKLKSGEYKQGKDMLHNRFENTFCCLGVLCDMYSKEKGVPWNNLIHNSPESFMYNSEHYLPEKVIEWAGFDVEEEKKLIDHQYIYSSASVEELVEKTPNECSLPQLNDGGKDFKYISNVIDERL